MIQSQHFKKSMKVTTIVRTMHSLAEVSKGEHLVRVVLASIDNQQHQRTKIAQEIRCLRSQHSRLL